MITLTSLWLPILLSSIAVFLVSSVLHIVFKYHNNDFRQVPDEAKVMENLQGFNIPPGDYVIPYASNNKERNSQEFKDKIAKGPVAFFTVLESKEMAMGTSLVQWFIYSIIVGIFAAYLSSRTLAPGEHYLTIFRVVGCTAFMGYSLALLQNSIWYRRNWSATLKSMFDGLIYALFTAGVFGWLWPTI